MRYTNGVFEKTGLNIITMWDRISEPTYAQFANGMPSLLGSTINNNWFNDADITNPDSMFNYTYKYYPAETGVAYKNYLPLYGLGIKSGYLRSVDDAKSDIMGKMANYYESAPRFLYKQFVPWDVGGDIINMAQELKELYGDKIEFVRADHFFMLLNEANGMPYNLALRSDKATASSAAALAANAADGSISTGWTAAGGAGEYYQIDLGERCELYKYTLKNAGAAGMSETLNTKAYRLQYSLNGNDWATADTVTGNTKSIIYKTLPNTVAARYVKIVIDDPGADSKARIQDIEIHGTKLGITDDSAPVSVTRIALSGVTKTTLNTGDSLTLSKKVSPANVSNGAVTFKSSSSSALSVTQNGFVKAGKVTKPTAVKITADANDGSGKTASVLFTVRTGKVESVSLSKKKVTLNAGKKFALNAVASPSTARNKALGFKTTAKKVAAVSSKGVITAKGAGVAKITAFAKDGSGKKAVITVTVKPAAPTKVKVTRTQSEAKVSCKKVAGAKKYEFYAKKKGGGWKKAAVVSKNSCAVKGLSKKAKYSFRVRAVGKAGSKKLYGKYSKATKLK